MQLFPDVGQMFPLLQIFPEERKREKLKHYKAIMNERKDKRAVRRMCPPPPSRDNKKLP